MTADAQRYQAHTFLKALFAYKPASTVVMVMQEGRWERPDAYHSWQPVVEQFGRADVYVGCCALVREPGRGSRGKESEAGFFPGAWADVDINGSPIRGSDQVVAGHAPSLEAASRAIVTLAPPTLVVHSGYGLQAWWLVEQGVKLLDAGMQRRAKRCVQGLQRRLSHDAGWKVDATGDLARVLRLPGTVNTKSGTGVPVRLSSRVGPRYTLEDLEKLAGDQLEQADKPVAARPVGEWVQLIRDGDINPAEGAGRHDQVWRLAGYLLRREIDPEIALELVQAFNLARLKPPYDEERVKRLFDGVVRLEVSAAAGSPRGVSTCSTAGS